jgi:hypothetical protein
MAATVDGAKLEQFMGQMVGHMTGTALCFGIWVGDELGATAVHGVVSDLHAELAVAGGRPRPRGAGRGGPAARSLGGRRLQPVPPRRRDRAQPHHRSPPVTVVELNGTTLHYVIDGYGPPCMVLHGWLFDTTGGWLQ